MIILRNLMLLVTVACKAVGIMRPCCVAVKHVKVIATGAAFFVRLRDYVCTLRACQYQLAMLNPAIKARNTGLKRGTYYRTFGGYKRLAGHA